MLSNAIPHLKILVKHGLEIEWDGLIEGQRWPVGKGLDSHLQVDDGRRREWVGGIINSES